jgi:hypothetical protein
MEIGIILFFIFALFFVVSILRSLFRTGGSTRAIAPGNRPGITTSTTGNYFFQQSSVYPASSDSPVILQYDPSQGAPSCQVQDSPSMDSGNSCCAPDTSTGSGSSGSCDCGSTGSGPSGSDCSSQ